MRLGPAAPAGAGSTRCSIFEVSLRLHFFRNALFPQKMQTILSLDGPLPACSGLLLALLLLVLLDYITGVCVAIQTKTLSSQIGAKGITKKVAMFVVIAFCHVLDTYLLQSETALAALSSVFYLSNEAISILENVGRLGVPLPEKLRSILAALKSKENGKQDQ